MIVVGADTHKRSHTIAAIAAGTGELLGERTAPVGCRGFGRLLRWARSLDEKRVWALADCRHVSASLERFLIERGERVLRIPAHLTAKARKSARRRGKSDPIDALNVARVALQEGLEVVPAAHPDGPELDLRLLVDHRERLVRHRVELNSTPQWHLHDLWPELELPGGALFSKKWATHVGRRLARASPALWRRGSRSRRSSISLSVRAGRSGVRRAVGGRHRVGELGWCRSDRGSPPWPALKRNHTPVNASSTSIRRPLHCSGSQSACGRRFRVSSPTMPERA